MPQFLQYCTVLPVYSDLILSLGSIPVLHSSGNLIQVKDWHTFINQIFSVRVFSQSVIYFIVIDNLSSQACVKYLIDSEAS